MKYILAILLTAFLSCGDGKEPDLFNPKDAGQIEGFWRRSWGVYTTYYFSNGKAVVDTWQGNSSIIHREYSYNIHRDTVFFSHIPEGDAGKWIVNFADINTAVVVAPVDSVSLFFTLKRL